MEFDVVVLGSGVSGSVSACLLAKTGLSVAVLTKTQDPEESNTFYAQGGIVYKGKDDSPDLLAADIANAGGGICNPEAVRIVAEEGDRAVDEILIREFGVPFTKDASGAYDLTEEGAHSSRRILHTFDSTGRSIEQGAVKTLRSLKNLSILTGHTAIDIITYDHHSSDAFRMYHPVTSLGVYALDNATRTVKKILCKVLILATGGMGEIYLHTSNPASATGDGYAMAARAGARLINMEYTQFHPTTLFYPKANNFLISEAVRGEGAVLIGRDDKPFMHKYHPLKDLAPRDVVTRAILNEMIETGEKFVRLDMTGIGADKLKARFPNIDARCREFGLDITESPVPIVPAFHFSCGGILTGMDGRTNIDRLFAVGEVACTGLHGANRLASTSLLEGVVFGKRTAEAVLKDKKRYLDFSFPEVPDWIDTGMTDAVDPALLNQDWNLLKSIMWNYVGAVRSEKRLRRALTDLNNLKDDIEDFYRDTKVQKQVVELRNAVQTALVVARQALSNRESLGTHYRVD